MKQSNYAISDADKQRYPESTVHESKDRGGVVASSERRCTDTLCLLFILVLWALMTWIGYYGIIHGDPYRLIAKSDDQV